MSKDMAEDQAGKHESNEAGWIWSQILCHTLSLCVLFLVLLHAADMTVLFSLNQQTTDSIEMFVCLYHKTYKNRNSCWNFPQSH